MVRRVSIKDVNAIYIIARQNSLGMLKHDELKEGFLV